VNVLTTEPYAAGLSRRYVAAELDCDCAGVVEVITAASIDNKRK
jgi:hypothetical protein